MTVYPIVSVGPTQRPVTRRRVLSTTLPLPTGPARAVRSALRQPSSSRSQGPGQPAAAGAQPIGRTGSAGTPTAERTGPASSPGLRRAAPTPGPLVLPQVTVGTASRAGPRRPDGHVRLRRLGTSTAEVVPHPPGETRLAAELPITEESPVPACARPIPAKTPPTRQRQTAWPLLTTKTALAPSLPPPFPPETPLAGRPLGSPTVQPLRARQSVCVIPATGLVGPRPPRRLVEPCPLAGSAHWPPTAPWVRPEPCPVEHSNRGTY